jgi:hypothetical protein
MTSRRWGRCFAIPYLTCLLCAAALFAGKLRDLSSEALQTVSSRTQRGPLPFDEYEKIRAEVMKKATGLRGPKFKNPAILSYGLTPRILRVLQEQRTYLETHGAVTLEEINGVREVAANNPGESSLPRHFTCYKPMIRSVNGKANGVVFTPIVANNTYKIEGCFFGDTPGVIQLEAHTGTPEAESVHPITMHLDSTSLAAWSDHEITAQLDTELRGIPDYPVTLVIYSARHRRIELRGCRFVAARGDPQLLTVIPSAWVKLYPSGVGSRSIRQLEYVSPTQASGAVPKDVTASSAFVVRSDTEQFGIGRDSYDFSQLNPGWAVESVQLQTYRVSCPEVITSAKSFGRWEAEWTSLGVRVAFEDSVCTSSVPPSFAFNVSLSQYAIRAWVVGPVGTQPRKITGATLQSPPYAYSNRQDGNRRRYRSRPDGSGSEP